MALTSTGTQLVVGTGAVLIAALLVTTVVCTGLGAHGRGYGVPLSVIAALAFPVTWTLWYVVDEHPYARRNPRSA